MKMLIVFTLNDTQTHTNTSLCIYIYVYVYKFLYKNMYNLKSHYKQIEKEYITKENDVKKYIKI